MAMTSDPQTRIDENVIDDPELLEALDLRSKAKNEKKSAASGFDLRHAEALALIEKLGLDEGDVVRIGTYRITKTKTGEPKDVSFTTSPASRVSIRELGD